MDALTGQIVEFRRKETILNTNKPLEMDYDIFELLHTKVLDWLVKLELPITDSELLISKKYVEGNNERFELEYFRQKDGFKVRDYQMLYFVFNNKHDIVSLRVRWDDVEFVPIEKYLSIDEIKQKLSPEQLVLVYLPRKSNPIYACKDEWFDAATGRKTESEEIRVVQSIQWAQQINVKKKKIKAPSKPLISNKLFDSLILEDGITEVDTSRDIISAETAWLQLKDKVALSLGYRVHPYDLRSESPLKRLTTLEYELQCNWICDAITNQVFD